MRNTCSARRNKARIPAHEDIKYDLQTSRRVFDFPAIRLGLSMSGYSEEDIDEIMSLYGPDPGKPMKGWGQEQFH